MATRQHKPGGGSARGKEGRNGKKWYARGGGSTRGQSKTNNQKKNKRKRNKTATKS